jgi:predicted XRE-type DNA-binding protein
LVDLGFDDAEVFDDAEELSVKAGLAMKLNALLEAQGLTQAQASKILGMPQPEDFGNQKLYAPWHLS